MSAEYINKISVNGMDIEVHPSNYSFSLTDSIYSLYNYGTASINDQTGLLQEYSAFEKGSEIVIDFGTKSHSLKGTFIVSKNKLEKTDSPNMLNGVIDIGLINSWYDYQEPISSVYKNRISEIVKRLIAGRFRNSEINDTSNMDTWYQTLVSNAKFIESVLLPNSYADNANNTPFYAFIQTGDIFNFRNFKSMMTSSSIEELVYTQPKPGVNFSNVIQSIKKLDEGLEEYRKYLSSDIYELDLSGELVSNRKSIKDYFPEKKTIPILNATADPKSYQFFPYASKQQKENREGQKLFFARKSLIIDRFMILIPFNPFYNSGKTIDLKIKSYESPEAISSRFSGKYLIEVCEHIWDGKNNRAYTKLIIGRPAIDIPNKYTLKERML